MEENPSRASLNENGDWEVSPNLNGTGDVVIFDSFCRPEQVSKTPLRRTTIFRSETLSCTPQSAYKHHRCPFLTAVLAQVDVRNADRDPARFPRTRLPSSSSARPRA